MLNKSYIGFRKDIFAICPQNVKNVLDVGCSTGALGRVIKEKTGASVWGIEISEEMGGLARDHLDNVLIGDVSQILSSSEIPLRNFDLIILGDILEHLIDPWGVISTLKGCLTDNGSVVASIPNVANIHTISNLIFKKHWPYRERGVHDSTHLRFFGKRDAMKLFENAGFSIDHFGANYRLFEEPRRFNGIAKFLYVPFLRDYLAHQWLIRASIANNKN